MQNSYHRHEFVFDGSGSQACRSRSRRRSRNGCVIFLLATLHANNRGCRAFVPPSRTLQKPWIDDHHKAYHFGYTRTIRHLRKTRNLPSSTNFSSKRRSYPESTRLKGIGEGEGTVDENNTSAKEEAERKKWGHDGTSDVYEDLENLERAIRLENSEFKLKHAILKEKVDFIDQNKRKVLPDVLRFVVVPLIYAFGLFKMVSHNSTILQTFSRSAIKAMDIHFWIFVVWAPVLLNVWKRISKPPPPPVPDELRGADLECAPTGWWGTSAFDWEDPRENCDDSVLYLTEYWTSAVNGMVYLQVLKGVAQIIASKLTGKSLDFAFQSNSVMLWLSCAQVLTRLGAVASLYQYPEKMYDLERSELTRPVGFFPTMMFKLVRVMMALAPLGFITDFSKVLLYLPRGSIYPLYATIAVSLYGTWARMQRSVLENEDPLRPTLLKPAKPGAKIVYGLSYIALWRKQLRMLGLGKMVTFWMNSLLTSFYSVFWKTLGLSILLPLPFLGPLIHLKAFSNIFEVEYANDLPAISTAEAYQQAVDKQPERAYNMAWRYNIRWRTPQRFGISRNLIYNDIVYRTLIKGTAVDILEQLSSPEYDKEAFERSLKQKPSEGSVDWKARAMEFQAKKHQKSYESGTMEDPLGVAVWRAFGIGIGFNFEHMKELGDGEEPSPRRLQARAAKSALRRYNELNKAEKELIRHNESLDPEDRDDKKVEEMKRKVDEEIKYIAGRLTELIPTTSNMQEFGELEVKKFTMKTKPKYRKISDNEIQMLEDNPFGSDEGALRGRYTKEKDYKKLLDIEGEAPDSKSTDTDNKGKTLDTDDISDDNGEEDELLDIEYV